MIVHDKYSTTTFLKKKIKFMDSFIKLFIKNILIDMR